MELIHNETITGINKNEKIKIKFEVDIMPLDKATYKTKYQLLPIPYSVKVFSEASLFVGKIHAVICSSLKSRVKGRDLYDYIFYLQRNTKLNIEHLKEKLIESEYINKKEEIKLEDIKMMLKNRFNEIDFSQAKNDAIPFIKDTSALDIWSKEFFIAITGHL